MTLIFMQKVSSPYRQAQVYQFNSYKLDGLSHSYQLDPTIFKGLFGGIFDFYSILNRAFSRQTVEQKVECCKYSLELAGIYYKGFGIFMIFSNCTNIEY